MLKVILFFLGLCPLFSQEQTLVVAIGHIPPLIFCNKNEQFSGFSIELFERIAAELKLDFRYEVLPFSRILPSVKNGDADLAFAGITITEEREKELDFSHPVFNSGLRIMTAKREKLLPSLSKKTIRMLCYLLIFIIFCAHVLWFTERGKDAIDDKYFPGILEAAWCTVATMTTVGYGDIAPKGWVGRLMATMIMLSGISAFSIITANLASEFSLENSISNISSFHDLKGIRTGTKSGTTSETLLRENGVIVIGFDEIEQSLEALLRGEIEAIVFDEPVIRWMAKENPDKTTITGEMFALQNYGIALRKGDKLRKQINLALLKLQEDGIYNEIYNRWFNNP